MQNSSLLVAIAAFAMLIGVPLSLWGLVAFTNRKYVAKRKRNNRDH